MPKPPPIPSRSPSLFVVAFAVLGAAWTAPPAAAVDGVLEINQACATSSGCFPGDGAGFPVSITAPGSYRLTSDLVVPSASLDGVSVFVSGVTLDLNGFTIGGPTVCDGAPLACSPTGFGSGVSGAVSVEDVVVRNGTIRGMGSDGVQLLHGRVTVEHLLLFSNGRAGVDCTLDGQAFLRHNRAQRNGDEGLRCGGSCIIADNLVLENGSTGILAASGDARVRDNLVRDNEGDGIEASGVVTGNLVEFNGALGIRAVGGGVITGNTVRYNGGHGIYSSGPAMVLDNNSTDNGGQGLQGNEEVGYARNVLLDNALGPVCCGAVQMGPNLCAADTPCP